jgi:cell division protein FtsQ
MIKKMHQKVRNFFLANKFLRKIRKFVYQTLLPFFFKALLLAVTLLVLVFIIVRMLRPSYLENFYRKSSFYFLHYFNLDNQEFSHINISGNKYVKKEEIIAIVEELTSRVAIDKSASYQPLIHDLIRQIKLHLPWVNQVVITRNMPDILNISITEYEPFAIWQNNDVKYLTDKEGNLIPFEDLKEFRHMVILSGKGANIHAKSLFNIFAADPDFSANFYSATWVSNRRWNIRFENGLLVKLPENNIADAWQRLIKIYNMPGSVIGLKTIDLRLSEKTYLEYNDSVIKELRNL